uniref:Uncharacterized protein n=1 Tax=Acrobeloides nanus TaxID=290746 RepID=A0A914BYH7_9BILA
MFHSDGFNLHEVESSYQTLAISDRFDSSSQQLDSSRSFLQKRIDSVYTPRRNFLPSQNCNPSSKSQNEGFNEVNGNFRCLRTDEESRVPCESLDYRDYLGQLSPVSRDDFGPYLNSSTNLSNGSSFVPNMDNNSYGNVNYPPIQMNEIHGSASVGVHTSSSTISSMEASFMQIPDNNTCGSVCNQSMNMYENHSMGSVDVDMRSASSINSCSLLSIDKLYGTSNNRAMNETRWFGSVDAYTSPSIISSNASYFVPTPDNNPCGDTYTSPYTISPNAPYLVPTPNNIPCGSAYNSPSMTSSSASYFVPTPDNNPFGSVYNQSKVINEDNAWTHENRSIGYDEVKMSPAIDSSIASYFVPTIDNNSIGSINNPPVVLNEAHGLESGESSTATLGKKKRQIVKPLEKAYEKAKNDYHVLEREVEMKINKVHRIKRLHGVPCIFDSPNS